MNYDLTPNRVALALGCALLAGGYYFGITSADQGALAMGCLGAGSLCLVASLVLFLKQENEKERRRMDSFMRAVDNMPMDMPVPDPPLDCAPGQVGQAVLHPIEEDMEPPQPIIPQPTYQPHAQPQDIVGQVVGQDQGQQVPMHYVPMQEMQPVPDYQQAPVAQEIPVQQAPVPQYTEAPVAQEIPVQQAPVPDYQQAPVAQEIPQPVQEYQQAPVAQEIPVQQAPVPDYQQAPVAQEIPVQQAPVAQFTEAPVAQEIPQPATQTRVRPSLEKARAEAEQIRAQALATRNRQARPPVRQEQRFSPTPRQSLAEKMNAPAETAKPVSVDELPSFNQEDWGVYEEKNIK